MNFDQYQHAAMKSAIYPGRGKNLWYPALGLAGEAGELANKVKKVYRDGVPASSTLGAEIGDVLWYCAALADELGMSLNDIAQRNIEKLSLRMANGTIGGEGDQR